MEKERRDTETILLAQDLRKEYPSFLLVGYTLVRLYLKDGDLFRAQALAKKMAASGPEASAVLAGCAALFKEAGYPQEARRLIGAAPQDAPEGDASSTP